MVLSINGARKIEYPHAKKKKKDRNLDTDLTSFTKIYSKWIVSLNVKGKNMKLLKDNIEKNIGHFGFGNELLI